MGLHEVLDGNVTRAARFRQMWDRKHEFRRTPAWPSPGQPTWRLYHVLHETWVWLQICLLRRTYLLVGVSRPLTGCQRSRAARAVTKTNIRSHTCEICKRFQTSLASSRCFDKSFPAAAASFIGECTMRSADDTLRY